MIVAKALNKPRIVYTPRQDLRDAVAGIKLQVNNPYRQPSQPAPADEGGETPDPGTGGGGETPGGGTPGGDNEDQ